ncbi:MAG TPA: NAD(P)/FAD-dependent oxidoreductase [Nitrososphaera sp.]|nr:NAD(P)/FAD-dependent oxidoreductase [Nitrososphaera sp.]
MMAKEDTRNERQRVIVLGSGFAGVEVLKGLEKKFHGDDHIDITMISKDNFLLFTPMLPEVCSGMIDPREITTPVRGFIKDATFCQADVESIDLRNKQVEISHQIGKSFENTGVKKHTLGYDYLVIALGNEVNFFGQEEVKQHAFTMIDVDDAIKLRNHVINMLEQAALEQNDAALRKKLLTFIVVGGGFNGIETVGELNDFIRETAEKYYRKDISEEEIRVVLIHASDKILEQIDEGLGKYALESLKRRGVEFILNRKVTKATKDSATLDNNDVIPSFTLVWSAGVTPGKLIADLECSHDKKHRLQADKYLQLQDYPGTVYVAGDCASIPRPDSDKPYPPTAQHALREARTLVKNLICDIERKPGYKKEIDYKTRGMMAEIGRRNGVALLFGSKTHGIVAWWLWRTFYLSQLPTLKKKLKVLSDWTMDFFYRPDVSMIKGLQDPKTEKAIQNMHDKGISEAA